MKTWIYFFTAMTIVACSKKQERVEPIKLIEQLVVIDSSRYFKLYVDNQLVYKDFVNYKSSGSYKVFVDLYDAGKQINFIRAGYNGENFTQNCRKDYTVKEYVYQNQVRFSVIEGLTEEKVGDKLVKIEFKQYY